MFQSQSLWLQSIPPARPPLRLNRQTGAVIVGGGLTGVQAAYLLARAGVPVVLLERRFLGAGASGHSSGKVTASHGLIYSRIESLWGREKAQGYGLLQVQALAEMEALVKVLCPDCGWVRQTACLTAETLGELKALEREARAQQRAGLNAALTQGGASPLPVWGALEVPGQAQFDPVAYLRSVAQAAETLGAEIYEDSPVLGVGSDGVYLKELEVRAPFVLLCTRVPIVDFPGGYCFRLAQRVGLTTAAAGTPAFEGMYQGGARGGYSLRRAGHYTLISGFDLACGADTDQSLDRHLIHMAQTFFPGCQPEAVWETEDGFSPDYLPYVGPMSPQAPTVLIAAGFQRWGMTNSYAAARILADRVLGKRLEAGRILSPQRSMLQGLPGLIRLNARAAAGFLAGAWRLGRPRCPHMGCRLKYRAAAGCWECPCHGSRFDPLGRVISAPARHSAPVSLRQRPRAK